MLLGAGVLGLGVLTGVAPVARAVTCESVADRSAYDGAWKGGENNTLVGGFGGLINFVETKYTRAGAEPVVYLGQFVVDAKNVLTSWSGTQLIGDGSTVHAAISGLTCDGTGKPSSFTADVVRIGTDKKKTELGTFTMKKVALGSTGS
ncbi:hypothetical protein [Nocardia brasiliensis]|uniref:Uncharacterized protein n=1 Tax=Nocardia brasiliensis (strain ATCC 700358 / HUJEG-1) TaxID=1133849 RepID=K0EX99_NOCB7|nr:hypothetical protein [Nocardia brasiliensis]AFU04503.1 hypothetical protein O3I_032770 [Nocardia brasiliensis ATCC 700358]OCF85733.1 hypothetical protein AW168_34920 [Nocardia brasiliensis]